MFSSVPLTRVNRIIVAANTGQPTTVLTAPGDRPLRVTVRNHSTWDIVLGHTPDELFVGGPFTWIQSASTADTIVLAPHQKLYALSSTATIADMSFEVVAGSPGPLIPSQFRTLTPPSLLTTTSAVKLLRAFNSTLPTRVVIRNATTTAVWITLVEDVSNVLIAPGVVDVPSGYLIPGLEVDVFIIAPLQSLFGSGVAAGGRVSVAASEGFADNIDITPLA